MNTFLKTFVSFAFVALVSGCASGPMTVSAPQKTYGGLGGVDVSTNQSRVEQRYREDELVCYDLYKNEISVGQSENYNDCIKRAQKTMQLASKQEQVLYKTDQRYRKDERKAQKEAQKLEIERMKATPKTLGEYAKAGEKMAKAVEKAAKAAEKWKDLF